MRRPICEDDLIAFVDGALDEQRRGEVADYLAHNPNEMSRVTSYRNQATALRQSLEHVAEEPVPSRLNIRNMVEGRRASKRFAGWHLVTAASLFLVVGAFGGWISRDMTSPPTAGIASLAVEASASYQAFADDSDRPVEVRQDSASQLATLASAAIGASAGIPDLSSAGYRLMGGRVVPTVHGPAYMVMFDDDKGSRLVMVTRRMAVEKDSGMRATSKDGVNAWTWSVAGTGYSIVGATPSAELKAIADEAKAKILPI